jgi:acyl carrier protein
MRMADFESQLLEIIKGHAVGLTGELTRETPVGDLGIDSMSIVEIIYEVEEKLGVEVPFNANQNPFGEMKTVGDLLDAVKTLIDKKH